MAMSDVQRYHERLYLIKFIFLVFENYLLSFVFFLAYFLLIKRLRKISIFKNLRVRKAFDQGFLANRKLPSLLGGSLEVTFTVP